MTNVRALFQAATVAEAAPPYNTLHLKIFYPAQTVDSNQNLAIVPAEPEHAPFPVVIFFNGINCGKEQYQWLAIKLAERGLVVVTFAWVAENLPGIVSLTPGVDLKRLAPDTYGTGATASALPTLLAALARLQTQGVLAGLLDLDKIILGGHSAGGRVAIESAAPQFFPQVAAAFAYGAHTAAITQLGYAPGTILPLPDALPLLLMAGTCDGVIARSSDRYGVTWEEATTPVRRTFQEAITGGRGDSYLLVLEGANHFSIANPVDQTIGSLYLDQATQKSAAQVRRSMVEMIGLFVEAHVRSHPSALNALNQYLASSSAIMATFERK